MIWRWWVSKEGYEKGFYRVANRINWYSCDFDFFYNTTTWAKGPRSSNRRNRATKKSKNNGATPTYPQKIPSSKPTTNFNSNYPTNSSKHSGPTWKKNCPSSSESIPAALTSLPLEPKFKTPTFWSQCSTLIFSNNPLRNRNNGCNPRKLLS